MNSLWKKLRRFHENEDGPSSVEYVLILGMTTSFTSIAYDFAAGNARDTFEQVDSAASGKTTKTAATTTTTTHGSSSAATSSAPAPAPAAVLAASDRSMPTGSSTQTASKSTESTSEASKEAENAEVEEAEMEREAGESAEEEKEEENKENKPESDKDDDSGKGERNGNAVSAESNSKSEASNNAAKDDEKKMKDLIDAWKSSGSNRDRLKAWLQKSAPNWFNEENFSNFQGLMEKGKYEESKQLLKDIAKSDRGFVGFDLNSFNSFR